MGRKAPREERGHSKTAQRNSFPMMLDFLPLNSPPGGDKSRKTVESDKVRVYFKLSAIHGSRYKKKKRGPPFSVAF